MTKNEFKHIMTIIVTSLKRNEQLTNDIAKILQTSKRLDYNDDKYALRQYVCDDIIINQLIDFVQQSFNDEYDTVKWWIYDCNFGTNNTTWHKNNEKYNCKTINDLYYMLTEIQKNK